MKRVFRGLKRAGRASLRSHLLAVATRGRERHGPIEGWPALRRLLADRDVVRHPTTLAFADAEIPAGLFARTVPPSGPNGSYCICLAERYASDESLLPLLVAYHIPTVNYGRMPTAEDALAFGAALLGLSEDEYHHHLCAAVDDGQQGLLAG